MINQNELDSWRARLLLKQRTVAGELSPRFDPVREQLESWIVEAAGDFPGDLVTPDAKTSTFRSKPGIYARLYIDDAKQVQTLRTAALESLRDGFTSCFVTYPNPDPFAGPACAKNSECPSGQHCNEALRCSEPAQPFNLRVAYRATRVLTDDWVKEVRDAKNDMRLRLLERDYDFAVHEDIPLAIELFVRAQYFMLLLDENVQEGVEVPEADTYSESLQAVKHPVRVFVWDLASKKQLLRVRLDIETSTIMRVDTDAEVPADVKVGAHRADMGPGLAVRRQANNCGIGVEVRRMLEDVDAVQ